MSTQRDARLLEERARALAARPPEAADEHEAEAVVVASVGNDRIGFPLLAAREVVANVGAAVVPGAPGWLKTIVQLRGELLSVLDLQAWWRPGQSCAGRHLMVVEGKRGAIAVVVDTVMEVREVRARDLASALSGDAMQARPGVRAVTRDLVFLLDIDAMEEHSALIVHHGAGGEPGAHE